MIQKLSPFHLLTFISTFLLDRITKAWAFHALQGPESKEIFSFDGIDIFFTFATNTGAAWGFMSSFPTALIIIRFCFIFFLFYLIAYTKSSQSSLFGLILILSGAISNILDSFIYGVVIDMIHFRFWSYDYPIFNLADCCITIGTCIFLISTLFKKEDTLHL